MPEQCYRCGAPAETEVRGKPVCIPCEDLLLGILQDAQEEENKHAT